MADPSSKLLCVHFFTLLLLYIHSCICLAADRITPNNPLRNNETIVSAGGVFELGFFSPSNSNLSYVGIWYHNILPQTVVWVGNRDNPIFAYSPKLSLVNANLIVYGDDMFQPGVVIAPSSKLVVSNPVAVLQDDGNFVISDSDSFRQWRLWGSFNNPTDTLLPGQLFLKGQLLISWNSKWDPGQGPYSLQSNRGGTGDYVTLYHNVSTMYSIPPKKFEIGSVPLSFNFNNYGFVKTRIIMNSEGMVQRLSWVEASKNWSLDWQEPQDHCQIFGYCGPFGSCDKGSNPLCRCATGFIPKSEKEWSLGNFSRGCLRKSSLGCRNSGGGNDNNDDMFVQGYGAKDLDGQSSIEGLSYVGSGQLCESVCSSNCNCTAYFYQSNRCSIWTGDVFNLHKLSKDQYNHTVYIRIAGSKKLDNVIKNPDHVRSSRKRQVIIGAIVGSVVAGILVNLLGLFFILRRNSTQKAAVNMAEVEQNKYGIGGDGQNDTQLSFFSFKDVLVATDNFSESKKLGEGGFGPVYKGKLSDDQEVAMKRLSKKSGQGLEEFMNELKLIAKLQHTYLVRLLGCCVESEEKILIYEYMPNKSLDKFLFGSSDKAKLDWGQRVKIAEGVAQGLLYIHKYSRLKVIHRDMKASNVLLDAGMNPKISDFGMARIFGIDQDEASTNRIVGTYGYMSPEYANYGQFSEKSDVFSFGVLLLEIVSGKRNKDFYYHEIPFSLLCWVWELWKDGTPQEVIDPAVKNSPCCNPAEAVKFIQVGLLCVQEAPADRPTMSSVTLMLLSKDSQSFPSPGEPAFITRRSVHPQFSYEFPSTCSNNQVTMSFPTGR